MPEDNLYQRGEIWWLRATVNGTEFRESLRTSDVKAARRKRDARLKQIKDARRDGKPAIGWKQAVADWAAHVAGQIAPATAKRYGVSLKQCEGVLSAHPVAEIDGKVINALIAGRKRAGASAATIRRDLTAVSRVLEHAEAMEWREGNPTLSKRRLLKERRDPIELPRHEAIEEVIAASSRRFGAFIRAAWLTGCRQDELVRLEWRQFNAKAETLDVIGKGNKRRTLALSAQATAHFEAQPVTLGSDLIFCRESGEAFAEAASDFCHFRREVEKRAKAERRDFKRFRYHDLRHLYAVEALREGKGIYDLSKHLGHTSLTVTEIYLSFLTPEEAQRAKQGLAQSDGTPRRFNDQETA
jgi:integrase/recombinase XerD